MKKMVLSYLVYVASAVTIIAFFMPWATVATSAVGITKEASSAFGGKFGKELDKATEALSEMGDISVKSSVSGYQIPKLVNDETSKVAISVAEMFFEDVKDLDKKSYLVYLLPILGIVCAALAFFGGKNILYVIPMVILSGGAAIGGLYKLYTTNVSSLAVQIVIQNGLWFTMYSFLFISIVGIVWFIADKKKLLINL